MSKTIKVAINSLKGDDVISGHTGKSRKFWIFEIKDKQVVTKSLLELERDQTIHHVFHESNDYSSPIFDADFIITSGIGQGAINRFQERGILAAITSEVNVDRAIALLMKGELPIVAAQEGQSCSH